MKIIDCHMHFSDIASFKRCAGSDSLVDYSRRGYIAECERNNIAASICMGLCETPEEDFPARNAQTPMLANLESEMPPGMFLCPGVNPHTLNGESLAALERLLAEPGRAVGVKIYAGYYHADVSDPVYEPVYRLAEKYGVPVAVHSGDTYSERGLLEYSHPLKLDRVAVNHRDMKLVICHMGTPWIFDSAELAYKNRNVYIDLSGMLCGSAQAIGGAACSRLQMDRYEQALGFLGNYRKLLFGTDWPLAPMDAYIAFIKALIPEDEREGVFYKNALSVYSRLTGAQKLGKWDGKHG